MKQKTNRYIGFLIIIAAVIIAAGILVVVLTGQRKTDMKDNAPKIRELLNTKKDLVIDCLGDSITWGMYESRELKEQVETGEVTTGIDDGGQLFEDYGIYISSVYQSDPSYPEVLETELNRRLKEDGLAVSVTTCNDGICGDWITAESYKRISCDPDIVILFFGGNNFYFDFPIEGMFEKNIKALREKGKILYLANYPLFPDEPYTKAFSDANDYIAKIAEQEKVPLIDLYSGVEALVYEGSGQTPEGMFARKELFSLDHIHLSEKGYALIGQLVTDALYKDFTEK